MYDKNLTIRFYRPGDESQINRLFEATFGIKRNLDEWRWKFQNNPFGESIIIVGELDNKIIAHIAAIPIGLKIGGKAFICYQSLDSMSDSSANTRLIFPRVFKKMQGEIESRLKINFGFPNKNAHDLLTHKRVGGTSIGKVDIFSAKLSAIFNLYPAISKHEFNLSEVTRFDDKFTHLWEELSLVYQIAVIRESRYLNWRYVHKPDNNYKIFVSGNSEIKGYIVLKIFDSNGVKIGSIIDLFAPRNSTVVSSMLGNALIYFNSMKVDLVVCCHRDKFLSQRLSEMGFSDTDHEGLLAQMWLIGSNFCPEVSDKIFFDESNWFITMGDSDWI